MEEKVTWGIALRIWWAWTWRLTLLMIVIIVPLQILLVFAVFPMIPASTLNENSAAVLPLWFFIIPLVMSVASFVAQVWVMKKVLAKEFPTFKISIIKK